MTSPIAERLRRWPAKEDAHVGVSELMMEAAADLDALRLALDNANKAEQATFDIAARLLRERDEALAKVTTLKADLSRAVEQCLEQQKLLDEYKAVHVAVCAERDDLEARCAELEAKINIDEKRFLLAWDALDGVIGHHLKIHALGPTLFNQVNSAKHGISGRSAIAPTSREGASK